MNQKKKSQEKNKFSKLRLHSGFNKSGKSFSPHPQEKISSYFSTVLNESEINSNFESTSGVASVKMITKLRDKKCVQEISTKAISELDTDSDTPEDLSDFTKPKIIKVAEKLENKSNNLNIPTRNIANRKVKIASKPRMDCLKNDINQEHLQLAIAMSKSISELENPKDTESEELPYPSTQQKIMQVKQTLDQFGFKSDKCPNKTNSKTNVKLMKMKKFKYFTPTLFLRTEVDRTKLIENKVSQIINNITIYNNTIKEQNMVSTKNTDNKPRSFVLRDYYKEEPILFNKNALCMSDAQENIFYNSIIQPSNIKVGVLLKDWLTIPGRETTPPLEDNKSLNKIVDDEVNIIQVPSSEISMSPELFTDSEDDNMKHIEKNNTSKEGFLNSTNSSTQIDKEKSVESYGSTKSVSLLDNIKANANYNKNTTIKNMSASRRDTTELSLSPFPDTSKLLNFNTMKQTKPNHDLHDKNDENNDSLSPFEFVNEEVNKSPQKKVTPKKKSPSPKKYVVTPKGRKIISPNYQKQYSPCKRSILFAEKQDVEIIHNESNNKSNEICHFESFCNDSIECFDLTHSSDDEVTDLEKNNKSFTVTQLLKELSPEKSSLNKENANKSQISFDSQTSIETMKLNISEFIDSNLDEEYSPELDCLNTSNNKVFYETLNNSLLSNNDYYMISSEKLSNNITENSSRNVVTLSNSDIIKGANCDSKIYDNRLSHSTPSVVKNIEDSAIKTIKPNTKLRRNRSRLKLRRSYSENFITDEKFQTKSITLSQNFGLYTIDNKLDLSIDAIERNNFNVCVNESNDNIFLSRSSISTCSDISDEELNYSCNSIYKRNNSSHKVISVSDEEDNHMMPPNENGNISIYNLQLQKSENNLFSANKSLQHPRVSKLSTPLKVIKNNEEKDLLGENIIQETITTTNNIATPKSDIIIHTDGITPKGHYSDMDTPERNRELEKFGLKPMKRNKGVKILHYIYDSTHPYVNESNCRNILNNSSDDENGKAKKRRITRGNEEISSADTRQNENQITCFENIEDMIFERKYSTKISSCRLPLHVAWNNLLINSKELQETILTYTPVQVEEIYEQLKNFGYKFHIQDIIAFLDKKCITIRIAQNNRHQKKANSIK